jgi:hypothetical protein
MSQHLPKQVALAASKTCAVASHQAGELHKYLQQLKLRAEIPCNAAAWARLAAHAETLAQSSYAPYLSDRIGVLLGGGRALSGHQLDGVRRVLEAVLDDVLQDPRRRGDAPAAAATFNEWWDCVVGLIQLEGRREQQRQRAWRDRQSAVPPAVEAETDECVRLDAGLELATWLQRLDGIGRQSALRRVQLLAELLAASGVSVEAPADDAALVARYQAEARRDGLQVRDSAARAALCDLSVGALLRLLAPRRCCALSKVAASRDGRVALADYAGCWAALSRISGGDLQLQGCGARAVTSSLGQPLQRVSLVANGQPFEFDYPGEAGGFDARFVEHLNHVAQSACLPGSFLVDRVNSDTDIDIIYLPLHAAAALQISGALSA